MQRAFFISCDACDDAFCGAHDVSCVGAAERLHN